MAQTSEEILRQLQSQFAEPAAFRGEPWYNAAGDCLIWYWDDRQSYRERVDDKLTVYRAFQDDELVGCQVKGVQALLNKLKEFSVQFEEKGVSLAILFYVSHFDGLESPEDSVSRKPVYDKLMQRASGVTFPLPADDFLHASTNFLPPRRWHVRQR